ncbi:MAG: ROK family protein [Bacteroidaceae bacterium]|jgi:glucokinase
MDNTSPIYALGIDIGGTNTAYGLVDVHGTVLRRGSIPTTEHPEPADYVRAVSECLRPLIEAVGGRSHICGLGIGAPNANYYTGTVEQPPNLPWKGTIPLAQLFRQELDLPVVLTNDANAAALGEMTYGVARGMKDFIMITLGTGVGSGIVCGGQLVYGHDGFAGELGHVTVVPGGRSCGCGRCGCLEAYCSATGVARTGRELLRTTSQESSLRALSPECITSKDICMAALDGDALARQVYEQTGELLGRALANFVAFTSPEAFVFFGGLTRAGELLFAPTRRAMEENLLPVYRGKVRLLLSSMPDADAAILGASALAFQEIKHVS